MTVIRVATVLLAAVLAAGVFPAPSRAQGARYEVQKGDTLFKIARKLRHPDATVNQMVAAIVRTNKDSLAARGANALRPGQILTIPPAGEIGLSPPTKPERDSVASVKEAPLVIPPRPAAGESPKPSDPEAAARRYLEGVALEKSGDHDAALKAFLDAGGGGHGLAQRKLGQIFDAGTPAMKRDYQSALYWYRKAREQGVDIPAQKPRLP